MNLLGCTIPEFKVHIEKQFTNGMSWDNHGRKKSLMVWEIDHIRPCSSFDLTKAEDQRACWHYTNLQPLWKLDNLSKGSKFSEF